MIRNRLLLIIAAGLLVVGCSSNKPASDGQPAKDGSSPTSATQTKQDDSAKNSSSEVTTSPSAETPATDSSKPAAASIPSSLKNDASEYFGLKDSAKLEYQVVSSDGNKSDLTRELTATKTSDAEATIEETATSPNGVQKFEHILKKDGIYSRQILDNGKKGELQMELPVQLAPGKKWSNKAKMETPLGSVDISSSSKVVGLEKVTVSGKSYDALKLQEQATLTGSATETWKTTTWLAKGVGLVKMEIDRTPKGKPSVKSTMTLK